MCNIYTLQKQCNNNTIYCFICRVKTLFCLYLHIYFTKIMHDIQHTHIYICPIYITPKKWTPEGGFCFPRSLLPVPPAKCAPSCFMIVSISCSAPPAPGAGLHGN